MWNQTQHSLLNKVISGMAEVGSFSNFERTLYRIMCDNAACVVHSTVLDMKVPMSSDDVEQVNAACGFLFEEFGVLIRPDDLTREYQPSSIIESKVELYCQDQVSIPLKLQQAFEEHNSYVSKIQTRPLDCLFVTAMPREFLAVARRLNAFRKGSSPNSSRGFKELQVETPGWVQGCVSDGKRFAKVMVTCGSRYGPMEARGAVEQALKVAKPRHVIVVGIAASLGDKTQLDLGDIGFSTELVDIHLGKDVAVTEFRTRKLLDLSKIPDHMKGWVKREQGTKYVFTGVLGEKDKQLLKNACHSKADELVIDGLVKSTRATAERTDLKSTAKSLPQPGTEAKTQLTEMVKAAQRIIKKSSWTQGIHVQYPGQKGQLHPRVVPATTLSGSRVVKQNGMRNYLKDTFPGALLVEMEAAGVGGACGTKWMPFVVKSACDWGTPDKEKHWQPYCADVAAAFAVELALELASK